mmetsp:Transcript_3930/g.4680  ORF Transcript_3930/g.4680 Transcript_3930/m.4680 type:complete len:191 (+) Transcript_3930:1418-1990(+)
MTMHAGEDFREIKIKIHDDTDWDPDEEFKIVLLCEEQRRLPGADTECTVLIIDDDKPGNIGFSETMVDVRRKQRIAYIELRRTNGCDGEISCKLNTDATEEAVPGKKGAQAGRDYTPIKDKLITFKSGEVTNIVEVEMPDCSQEEDAEAEEIDTVSFALLLSDPMPTGSKLSKRAGCFINIEAGDDDEDK